VPAKIGETPVIGLLPLRRKETTGDRAFVPVITNTFAAHALLGTIIAAGAILKIPFSRTFHNDLLMIKPRTSTKGDAGSLTTHQELRPAS
jgi:hypothetical protein